MNSIFAKTFGALSSSYYFRHLFFGLALSGFFVAMINQGPRPMTAALLAIVLINTLLYPYSRFVYEGIVNFIVGTNVFVVNAIFMLIVKCFSMGICWAGAIFIAPIGLIYLFFLGGRHSVRN